MSDSPRAAIRAKIIFWFRLVRRLQSPCPACARRPASAEPAWGISVTYTGGAGIPGLREHFALFPQKYRQVEIRRPYHRYLEASNTVVIEYEIIGELRTGETAIATGDTRRQHVRVIAVFNMRDGRIAEMREVAAANMGNA
jgi:ketosteroid isomerase-like protein